MTTARKLRFILAAFAGCLLALAARAMYLRFISPGWLVFGLAAGIICAVAIAAAIRD